MKPDPYRHVYGAEHALDAVQRWATSCYLLRETAALVGHGRLDGVLVPSRWDAPMGARLAGIEVKLSRGDFLRGLRSKQFEKYAGQVSGLYIVATVDACKTREIPDAFGHLVVGLRSGEGGAVCVCRRHPQWAPVALDEGTMWAILFDLCDQNKREVEAQKAEIQKKYEHACSRIVERVMRAISKIKDEA